MSSTLLDRAVSGLLKPFAGGQLWKSTNMPSNIWERFRARTPGATTMVSAALGLLLTPARVVVVAGWLLDRMVAILVIGAGLFGSIVGRELVIGKLLSPKPQRMLLEGMVSTLFLQGEEEAFGETRDQLKNPGYCHVKCCMQPSMKTGVYYVQHEDDIGSGCGATCEYAAGYVKHKTVCHIAIHYRESSSCIHMSALLHGLVALTLLQCPSSALNLSCTLPLSSFHSPFYRAPFYFLVSIHRPVSLLQFPSSSF